jgi:hypothetical protein
MRIRKFNESNEEDFISVEEVKEIFAQLYDSDTEVVIHEQWASGDTEIHLSKDAEDDFTHKVIVIDVSIRLNTIPFAGGEYGYDIQSCDPNMLRTIVKISNEIIDASSHLEGEGYETTTQINNFNFFIVIYKKGSLVGHWGSRGNY